MGAPVAANEADQQKHQLTNNVHDEVENADLIGVGRHSHLDQKDECDHVQ